MTEVRRGIFHYRAGPHLPDGSAGPGRPAANVADPANGERVPRCCTCGLPARPKSALLDFELRLHGRHAGHYRLCERCFERHNPPPVAIDPLEVGQTA